VPHESGRRRVRGQAGHPSRHVTRGPSSDRAAAPHATDAQSSARRADRRDATDEKRRSPTPTGEWSGIRMPCCARLTPPAGAPPARRKRDAPSEHTVAPALPHRAGWPRRDRRFCGAACCCACHACLTGKAEERIERHTPIAGPQRSRRRPHSGRRPRACCGQARKARSQNLPVSSTIGGDRS
jgi:hypothetical protein